MELLNLFFDGSKKLLYGNDFIEVYKGVFMFMFMFMFMSRSMRHLWSTAVFISEIEYLKLK
jgi:hypothetical protein